MAQKQTKKLVYQIQLPGEDPERAQKNGFDISVRAWKKWCERHGVEYCLYNEDAGIPPHWYKYAIYPALEDDGQEYDAVAYVDSDTIVHPDCPDFFGIVPAGKMGVVKNFGCLDWVLRGVENYGRELFGGSFGLGYDRYFNSGFMVLNRENQGFLRTINEYYRDNEVKIKETIKKCLGGQDQTIVNLLAARDNVDLHFLPYTFNVQDLQRRLVLSTEDMWYTDYGWIFHYNAGDLRPLMEKTYEKLWG